MNQLNLLRPGHKPPLEDLPATFSPQPAISEGRQIIGPELANRILEVCNYKRQRALKPFRLHRHVSTIERGQWDPDFGIRFAMLNTASGSTLVLVDGQHRLNAIVKTGKAQQFFVVVTPVSTWTEVHTMYSRIDVDGNRSVADVLGAADPTNGREVTKEMRRSAFKAMYWLANDFPHRRLAVGENELVTKEDRLVCMAYWLDELEDYDAIVNVSQSNLRRRMREPGVVAVALATLKHQEEQARTFWANVGRNSLLRPGDPEQALVNFLLNASLRDAANVSVRGAAQAWNSWSRRSRLQAIKKGWSIDQPIKIYGTPFQGRA